MKKVPEAEPIHPEHIGALEKLCFEHVSFKHQTAQYKALDDVNFEVEKGETIAFVGPSGAGKSTLVKLLVGLYHPQTGKVFYNNVDSNNILLEELKNANWFCYTGYTIICGHYKRKFNVR